MAGLLQRPTRTHMRTNLWFQYCVSVSALWVGHECFPSSFRLKHLKALNSGTKGSSSFGHLCGGPRRTCRLTWFEPWRRRIQNGTFLTANVRATAPGAAMIGIYSFTVRAKTHECDWPSTGVSCRQGCHHAFLLPDGSTVQMITHGRKDVTALTISFTDEAGQPCGAEEWGARQPVLATAKNVPDSYSCGGLFIEISTFGRKASASFNVYSATDMKKPKQCGICCYIDVRTLQASALGTDGGSSAPATSSDREPFTPELVPQRTTTLADAVGICDVQTIDLEFALAWTVHATSS